MLYSVKFINVKDQKCLTEVEANSVQNAKEIVEARYEESLVYCVKRIKREEHPFKLQGK